MNNAVDTIKIKRLVLVDSAGFCFIEIPIDRHAILLGKGNIGKSSLLNSLRLFLLPENNFNKSQVKFAFREPKKNAYYSNNDSYRHYFPSTRSFLILESENEAGTHCQILYRTNNLGYGRIFTPFSFDKIRSFFWDGTGDDEGIGQAVASLSISHIKESLKKLSAKTEIISDTTKLRRTLYAEPNELLDSDSTRYCLVPLHKVNEDNIESLRALILLLFEMDTSAESMAQALANIIESGKKTADDILDFDIDAFLTKHDELKRQYQHIVELRNLQPEFNKLVKDYDNYIRLSDTDKMYITLTQAVLQKEKKLKQEALDSEERFNKEEKAKSGYGEKLKALRGEIRDAKALLKDSTRRTKEQDEIIRKVTMLQAQYPDYRLDDIKAILQEYIEDIDKEIAALQSTESNLQLKAELEGNIARLGAQISQIENSLKNKEFQLLEQLPEQDSVVLSSIHKNLVMANPSRKITEEELLGISNFTCLFVSKETSLQWFDQDFYKQAINVGEDLQRKLADAQADLRDYEKKHKNISIEKDAISQKKEIDKLKKIRSASENDIAVIDNYPSPFLVEQEKKNKIKYETMIKKLEEKEEKEQAIFNKLEIKLVELKETRDEKNKAVGELNILKRKLTSLERRYARLKILSIDDVKLTNPVDVTEQRVEQLEDDLTEFDRLRQHIRNELKDLHRRGVINESELLSQAPNDEVIAKGITQLRDIFNELDNIEKAHKDYVHSHNESVASYAKVLRDNNEIIQRFEASINRELKTVTINDLTEIKASIAVHPKFRHLVDEVNKLDEHSEALLSDQFYERLKVFVETFFKEGEASLTMDKIITNLEYKTKKEKDDVMQDKAQSMSTTVLINLELVKILLKRVIPTGIRLEMPLIFDEAADINIDQFDWILPNLSEAGFSLFAAATHSVSTELIHKIGLWFSVDDMVTQQPYDSKRTLVFWNGGEGFEPLDSDNLIDLALADQTDWVDQQ
jgi:DNA repair exonuclease SbcCD ATPase subunit